MTYTITTNYKATNNRGLVVLFNCKSGINYILTQVCSQIVIMDSSTSLS